MARLRLAVWTVLLATAALVLHGVGGPLAPPPLTEPHQLSEWLRDRDAAEAAMAVLRLAALATAWYLVAATVAGTLARAVGVASWIRAADAFSTPFVRRLVHGAAGVSFATAVLAGAATAGAADERAGPAEPVIMRVLPDEAEPATPVTNAPSHGAPTMRRLDSTTATTPAPAPAPTDPGRREVAPGEHFWSVAEQVLTSAWGRAPADAEVDPYWRALVGANLDVLRDRGNPDLLFPGQVITVPPPPQSSGG